LAHKGLSIMLTTLDNGSVCGGAADESTVKPSRLPSNRSSRQRTAIDYHTTTASKLFGPRFMIQVGMIHVDYSERRVSTPFLLN
jgi:hypothetical protein